MEKASEQYGKKQMKARKLLDRFLWKGYFIALSLMQLQGIVKGITPRFWDIFDLVLSSFFMIGLFGYAWRKRIFNKAIWQGSFLINIVWSIIYLFIVRVGIKSADGTIELMSDPWVISISIVLMFPSFISLYFYGFKSNKIWTKLTEIKMQKQEDRAPEEKG
jgi:hypothetical protein